jgi:demethylmenaquinone methyltransferase/2-methoxy-6-polyprenyl-1,4-benzoquinol methylase
LSLPFSNNVFDSVVSGFFLRNTADVRVALIEQLRVLKPGGRVVILDTTRYTRSVVYPMVRFYTHTVIPLLGHLIAGNKEAYEYLSASTDRYFKAEDLAALMAAVGFEEICFERVMLDSVAIHWGRKQRQ